MKNEEKIFKKNLRRKIRKTLTEEKNSIKALVKKITELNEILPEINATDKTSMKYLSSLYSEAVILIKNITVYMVRNRYCGMHDSIDNTILKIQELVGILKEFESLDTSGETRDFYETNESKASILLQSLKRKMGELEALKKSTVEENDSLD